MCFISGHDAFFPLSMVDVSVPSPRRNSTKQIKRISIGQFRVTPLAQLSSNTFQYNIENTPNELIQLDPNTGEVWTNSTQITKNHSVIISAKSTLRNEISARMTLTLILIPTTTYDTFCMQHADDLCFWKSVQYTLTEETNRDNKRIGEIGSKGLLNLCTNIHLEYKILNGTQYVYTQDGAIYTKKPFDYDTFNPGPSLNVKILCQIRDNIHKMLINSAEKILRITILDRNDNPPRLQENGSVNIHLDDPHFMQVCLLYMFMCYFNGS